MPEHTINEPSGAIPISSSLGEVDHAIMEQKNYPVGKRVFYLSLQAIFNAIIIGCVAKLLVLFIALISNISFYGKFSFEDLSPGNNHLGWFVVITGYWRAHCGDYGKVWITCHTRTRDT